MKTTTVETLFVGTAISRLSVQIINRKQTLMLCLNAVMTALQFSMLFLGNLKFLLLNL